MPPVKRRNTSMIRIAQTTHRGIINKLFSPIPGPSSLSHLLYKSVFKTFFFWFNRITNFDERTNPLSECACHLFFLHATSEAKKDQYGSNRTGNTWGIINTLFSPIPGLKSIQLAEGPQPNHRLQGGNTSLGAG